MWGLADAGRCYRVTCKMLGTFLGSVVADSTNEDLAHYDPRPKSKSAHPKKRASANVEEDRVKRKQKFVAGPRAKDKDQPADVQLEIPDVRKIYAGQDLQDPKIWICDNVTTLFGVATPPAITSCRSGQTLSSMPAQEEDRRQHKISTFIDKRSTTQGTANQQTMMPSNERGQLPMRKLAPQATSSSVTNPMTIAAQVSHSQTGSQEAMTRRAVACAARRIRCGLARGDVSIWCNPQAVKANGFLKFEYAGIHQVFNDGAFNPEKFEHIQAQLTELMHLPLQRIVEHWLSPPTPFTLSVVINLFACDATCPPFNAVMEDALELSTIKQYTNSLIRWASTLLGSNYAEIVVTHPVEFQFKNGHLSSDDGFLAEDDDDGDTRDGDEGGGEEGRIITQCQTVHALSQRILADIQKCNGAESSNHMMGVIMQQDIPIMVDHLVSTLNLRLENHTLEALFATLPLHYLIFVFALVFDTVLGARTGVLVALRWSELGLAYDRNDGWRIAPSYSFKHMKNSQRVRKGKATGSKTSPVYEPSPAQKLSDLAKGRVPFEMYVEKGVEEICNVVKFAVMLATELGGLDAQWLRNPAGQLKHGEACRQVVFTKIPKGLITQTFESTQVFCLPQNAVGRFMKTQTLQELLDSGINLVWRELTDQAMRQVFRAMLEVLGAFMQSPRECRYGNVTQNSCNQLIKAKGVGGGHIAAGNKKRFRWASEVTAQNVYQRYFAFIEEAWNDEEQRLMLERLVLTSTYLIAHDNNTSWFEVGDEQKHQRWHLCGGLYHPESTMHSNRSPLTGALDVEAKKAHMAASETMLTPSLHNYEQHDEDLLESHYAGTLAEGKTQLEAFDEVHLPALDVDHIFVNPHFVPRCMKGWSDDAIESVVHTRKELKKLIERRKQVSVKRFQV